jgi:hypothetical protein
MDGLLVLLMFLKAGETSQAALQHASNAASLSEELLQDYAAQSSSWKGRWSPKQADM